MRSLATIVAAVVLSAFVAGIVQVQLGVWFDAHEEFIAVLMGQALFVVALAFALLLATVRFGTSRAVTVAALATLAGYAVFIALLEVVGLATDADFAPSAAAIVAGDGPIVLEAIIPAAIATLIQWWIVRRHILARTRFTVPA